MKTAAIYARVSSDRQKEEQTIASQTSALRGYAAEHEYVVPDGYLFEDEGWSGATLVRPGLERLRDIAAQGHVEAVLVHSPDRLSRKYAYQVLLLEEFARHGVDVVFLRAPRVETPEEVLLLQFQGMIAEYEKAQISERTRRGKRHRARRGVVNVLIGRALRVSLRPQIGGRAGPLRDRRARGGRGAGSVPPIHRGGDVARGPCPLAHGRRRFPPEPGSRGGRRSTIWAMLRNPAYQGTACFQKTVPTPSGSPGHPPPAAARAASRPGPSVNCAIARARSGSRFRCRR